MRIVRCFSDRMSTFYRPAILSLCLSLALLAIVAQADAAQVFDDRCRTLTSFNVRSGSWIDGFEMVCADGTRIQRGGSGGTQHDFTLQQGETITSISGTKNAPGYPYVMSLQIHTTKRDSPVYGADPNLIANERFSFPVLEGTHFSGLQGRAGIYLDDVTAINIDATTASSTPVPPPMQQQVQTDNSPSIDHTNSAAVLFTNSNLTQMGVYIDDPQRGLIYQFELPYRTSQLQYLPVGTQLVFGPPDGAAVGFYTVNANPKQRVVIGGEQQQAATGGTQPQPPPAPAPAPAAPQIQTTAATIFSDGSANATEIAGIGTVDESNLSTQFRTQLITLSRKLNDQGTYYPVVLDFNPQIYAWQENGSTYIRIDTNGSRLRVENYRGTQFDQGFFIEKIDIRTSYPRSLQLTDYFPQNNMDSTQVSSSRSLSIGGNAGPHPYSVGVSASLTNSYSASANVPDFKSETSHSASTVNTNWVLCGIPGQDNKGRTYCVYNEPTDLGFKEDGRWISGLSELPTMAKNFSSMRQTFVLSRPGLVSSTEEVSFQFKVDLRNVHLEKIFHEAFKAPAEIGNALACIDVNSAACKSMKKGAGLFTVTSRNGTVIFNVRLAINLAPLASTAQRLGPK